MKYFWIAFIAFLFMLIFCPDILIVGMIVVFAAMMVFGLPLSIIVGMISGLNERYKMKKHYEMIEQTITRPGTW